FLNRLDEIIYFKPLTKEDMRSITDLQFRSLKERVKGQGLELEISEKAKDYIIDSSYDPLYGARPIKRFIQNNLETMIARYILSHELNIGDRIKVDADQDLFIS
ncbi:MAG: ATP-dependent Clp protease ATP-binding subunit, partial [Firmicutes bacterium]|nr:ATP-dependent Clp protease ATP-binding subunit [Bacillota bacterium]